MREEFEKMAVAGKIEGRHIEPLVQLATSGFCMHRSWGFGRIKAVDTVFARFSIDFPNKPGHTMDLAFAAESLKPIPKDHILARKAADLEGLRQMAALHHLDLIKLVLNSYGGKATIDQIQQVLVPDVIRDDWKKWWETARREMKKDGHFIVPLKKTEPVLYQAQEVSLQDRLMERFPRRKRTEGALRLSPSKYSRTPTIWRTSRPRPTKSSQRSIPTSPRTFARNPPWRWRAFLPATICAKWPACRRQKAKSRRRKSGRRTQNSAR